ncbi:MAG: hypothetical protein HY981_02850 [Candidatus Magasanikbacteria bacterium]|nr:hypothetical protein [Candidatus Magasanikbacteria bacterium]
MKRAVLQLILRTAARLVIARYKPIIIGVSGSVGKTTAKEAISAIIGGRLRVGKTIQNNNNEVGVPLTVLGVDGSERSLIKWFSIMARAVRLVFFKDKRYPEALVVEMAADRPGDLAYLVKIASPQIGVVMAVGRAHLEFFKTMRALVQEKQTLISCLPADGFALLNADDAEVIAMQNKTRARTLTYGFGEKAMVRAVELSIGSEAVEEQCKLTGIYFKIVYKGSTVPVFLPGVLGRQHVYAALAGAAVGVGVGMNLVEVSERMHYYDAPPGRMRIVEGIKHTMLIDDTYNSSPTAAVAAVETLAVTPCATRARKFAVLGDMLELGPHTEIEHRELGKKVAELGIEYLYTVGERAKFVAQAAAFAGMKEDRISVFADAESAGKALQEKIKPNDVILIKGSQGMRMEKITRELMAEPLHAEHLLCRQYGHWLDDY